MALCYDEAPFDQHQRHLVCVPWLLHEGDKHSHICYHSWYICYHSWHICYHSWHICYHSCMCYQTHTYTNDNIYSTHTYTNDNICTYTNDHIYNIYVIITNDNIYNIYVIICITYMLSFVYVCETRPISVRKEPYMCAKRALFTQPLLITYILSFVYVLSLTYCVVTHVRFLTHI